MDIQASNVTNPVVPSGQGAGGSESGLGSALSSDFETFLKMLTTQMENQDPLNPIESSDFALQLATFSGVEQQIRTNGLLADMVAGNSASGLSQLAGWVGMEARVSGAAAFDGAPLTLAPDPDPASDAAYLIVRDTDGNQVSKEQLPLNSGTVLWGGVGQNGAPLPNGKYAFELESVNNGVVTSTKPVEHYALVKEARLGASGIDIVLSGGAVVSSSDVRALRTQEGAP